MHGDPDIHDSRSSKEFKSLDPYLGLQVYNNTQFLSSAAYITFREATQLFSRLGLYSTFELAVRRVRVARVYIIDLGRRGASQL